MEDYRTLEGRCANRLNWDCLFMHPFWLQTVLENLEPGLRPRIFAVYQGDGLTGILPLAVKGDIAHFPGPADVCDYQDLIAVSGAEAAVLEAVLNHLLSEGVRRLTLQTLHPDAVILSGLKALASRREFRLQIRETDVTYETPLPSDWQAYLLQLSGKQRHEVRRKIRRLDQHGPFAFHMAEKGNLQAATDVFLSLFRRNRQDKAGFMTDVMKGYFRSLIARLAGEGKLRLYQLELAGQPAAAALCFDHCGVRYLYNSGYDDRFRDLSVGLVCKLFSIQKGIEAGCCKYDFLKGAETYKKRIGGLEKPLYRCDIDLAHQAG